VNRPASCILDISTGTGLLALEAAQRVGPAGKVIGIDASQGMLAEARRKTAEAGLRNIDFVQADAEQLAFPHGSFDFIFCASANVLISDIPCPLRHWFGFLKPPGLIAFDAPAKPFGISQRIVEIAAEHGIHLTYADVANAARFLRGQDPRLWTSELNLPIPTRSHLPRPSRSRTVELTILHGKSSISRNWPRVR
jgi:ubiquinone/menaquinone biosynthesis C-methylase UbiE